MRDRTPKHQMMIRPLRPIDCRKKQKVIHPLNGENGILLGFRTLVVDHQQLEYMLVPGTDYIKQNQGKHLPLATEYLRPKIGLSSLCRSRIYRQSAFPPKIYHESRMPRDKSLLNGLFTASTEKRGRSWTDCSMTDSRRRVRGFETYPKHILPCFLRPPPILFQ